MSDQIRQIDVLVVDDSAVNRKFAERILKDEYSVLTADSGRQALELLESYEPKLILLDFRMPEMDGAETMAKIRANPVWEKIPVVILTADSAPETEKEFFEMGAADFIVKPFVPMTVKSRIGRMIELYGLRVELEDKLEEKSRLLEKVSLSSILAIADAYDAMTSNRIYRAKLPDMSVAAEFERCAGTQFDPHLAHVFVGMLNEGFYLPPETKREGDDAVNEQWNIVDDNSALLSRILAEYGSGKNALDSLTGLHNRGYGEKAIEQLLSEAHKGALMIMDLDNFKNVNDTYGHLMGDKVLRLLAAALSANVEDKDVLCRLGGDEFVAFLTDDTDREKLIGKVDLIMEAFAASLKEIEFANLTHISAGIALCPADGKNFSTLYSNADKALYYVKKNGKNSCSFYSSSAGTSMVRKPGTDLDHIRQVLEGSMDEGRGLFKVPYEEFPNLYSYLSRCVKRKGQMVQTILFTLGSGSQDYLDNSVCEEAMSTLEVAAAYSLRMVDVGSRYSSLQYIVILVDTNIENGRMVADRVVNQFYKIYAGAGVTLSYDIQTMVVSS